MNRALGAFQFAVFFMMVINIDLCSVDNGGPSWELWAVITVCEVHVVLVLFFLIPQRAMLAWQTINTISCQVTYAVKAAAEEISYYSIGL